MKTIGIIGPRGIGNYGGFESFVSALMPKLVNNDFEVYFASEKIKNPIFLYKGVKIAYFPFYPPKEYTLRKIYEIIHDIIFMINFSSKFDIIYLFGTTESFLNIIPRILRKRVIINVDGLEWKRNKFKKIEKIIMKFLFDSSIIFPNYLIIDNTELKKYIPLKAQEKTFCIPYAVSKPKNISWNDKILKKYCDKEIHKNNYFLIVARLEPENNIIPMIKGYINSKSKTPLLIIGNFSDMKYRNEIYRIVDNNSEKIILLGGIYNIDDLDMFRQNCLCYFHGHSVGGTNPSLLEAMSMKNIIIAHDNEFNREVGKDLILYFNDVSDLTAIINKIENNIESYIELKEKVYNYVIEQYSWDKVIELHKYIFDQNYKKNKKI